MLLDKNRVNLMALILAAGIDHTVCRAVAWHECVWYINHCITHLRELALFTCKF